MHVPSHLQWWSNLCTQFPQKWQWKALSGLMILQVWQNFIRDKCVELALTIKADPELEFLPLVSSMFIYVLIRRSNLGIIPGFVSTVCRKPMLVRMWQSIKDSDKTWELSLVIAKCYIRNNLIRKLTGRIDRQAIMIGRLKKKKEKMAHFGWDPKAHRPLQQCLVFPSYMV